MKKMISNIVYNAVYQLLIIAIPVITIPYVSRVLGAERLGINSYVMSITVFFSVIIIMGLNQVGVREIAKAASEDRLETFKNLWVPQLIMGIVVLIFFGVGYIFFLPYKNFFVLEVPYIVGYALDFSWYFVGIGKIKQVVVRNTIVKLISVICIFMFVKHAGDLWIYMLANSLGLLIANGVFLVSLVKEFGLTVFNFHNVQIGKYMRNNVQVMIPLVAVQLYTNIDSTIVGSIAGNKELSFYDQSQKIARIILAFLTSISTVIMPKLVELRHNKRISNVLLKLSLDFTFASALYFVALLVVSASQFIPWFFGAEFIPMSNNMVVVSFIVIFVAFGGVFANQFAIANGLYRAYAYPFYIGAFFSITFNFILVPDFGSLGGSWVIMLTELLVCISRIILLKDKINFRFLFQDYWKYIIAFGCAMLVNLLSFDFNNLTVIILKSLCVTVLFWVALILLRPTFFSNIKVLKKNSLS